MTLAIWEKERGLERATVSRRHGPGDLPLGGATVPSPGIFEPLPDEMRERLSDELVDELLRTTMLELGNNTACIVHCDADLAHAVKVIVASGFKDARQLWTSAQRVLAHRGIHNELVERLTVAVGEFEVGDPALESTDVGPMLHDRRIERMRQSLESAVANGPSLVTGGERRGNAVTRAVVDNVTADIGLARDEAFARALVLRTYDRLTKPSVLRPKSCAFRAGVHPVARRGHVSGPQDLRWISEGQRRPRRED